MSKLKPKFRKHYMREWRKFRGLTQEQVAARLDISQATLSRIEQLYIPYNQRLLEAAASAYRCQPSDILDVNPGNEGDVFGIIEIIRDSPPVIRAEILGYARGRLNKKA